MTNHPSYDGYAYQCYAEDRESEPCWGVVQCIDHCSDGDMPCTWACQGHLDEGEYVPPDEHPNLTLARELMARSIEREIFNHKDYCKSDDPDCKGGCW